MFHAPLNQTGCKSNVHQCVTSDSMVYCVTVLGTKNMQTCFAPYKHKSP